MDELCGICRYPKELCKCEYESLDKKDNISPSHYTQFAIPPNVYITENRLEWEEANVVKYITRHRFKNGKEDCEKAIKYIEMLIERLYDK